MATEASSLGALIDAGIEASGPITVAAYMGLCLTAPKRGYYGAADPLGSAGDFITAPEISQMFGELIGFFLVNLWQQLGEPASFTLLELGPGRGTLLADALRAAGRAPGFMDALHLQLFEASPALRELQRVRLAPYSPYWQDEIDAVGEGPLLVVANEFFDALPVRQFIRTPTGWHERLVGLRDGRRIFGLSPVPAPAGLVPTSLDKAAPGEVFELGLAAADAMARLSRAVARGGGAILAIDYGYGETRTGETLQAVRRHAFADPLEDPGATDLSAHVNFGVLSSVARAAGLTAHPLTSQGDFLRRLGLAERAESLAHANPGAAAEIAAAVDRLAGPRAMGDLFKVLCVTSAGLVPAGVST